MDGVWVVNPVKQSGTDGFSTAQVLETQARTPIGQAGERMLMKSIGRWMIVEMSQGIVRDYGVAVRCGDGSG